MSIILKILALLSSLQNSTLVLAIEGCLLDPANTTPALIWTCIVSKIAANPPSPNSVDAAIVTGAKALATKL